MLCNTNLSISLKNEIGQYKIENFNLFQINRLNDMFPDFNVYLTNNIEIELKLKCPICDRYHCYKFRIRDLINSKMLLGGCEYSGITIIYIGNTKSIYETINKYKEIKNMVYAMI